MARKHQTDRNSEGEATKPARNSSRKTKTIAEGAQDAGAAPRRSTRRAASPADERLFALAAARIAIEGLNLEIDGGRFPAKVVEGRPARVAVDVFSDGHDSIDAAVLHRAEGAAAFEEVPLIHLENDRWTADVVFPGAGMHQLGVIAWRDLFATWRKDVAKKRGAGQDIALELEEGRRLIAAAADEGGRAGPDDRAAVKALLADDDALHAEGAGDGERLSRLSSADVIALMRRAGPRTDLTRYKTLPIHADREAAAFSAWYELMPRSQSGDPARHGAFDDVIARLPYIRDLGFDVLYFPPIHPIGRVNRKGRDNTLTPGPNDPGSPYAIGSDEGGHDAIHPELGTFDDFKRLVEAANAHGLEIALDFAIQCAPDHPWIKRHPEWFDWRPDGSIKYAENPPKKYEDIVNVHFYRGAIPGAWHAMRDIVLFWIDHGVRIFRVDNPHTKPFPFWEWMIGEVHAKHPGAIFLAEAFTRPKVMKRLAKIGFAQSYSYFTWRNKRWEIEQYLTELTQTECRHYMRPNFFANTPDINPRYLQTGGRPAFRVRLALAATLGGNYGIYNGFEVCEAAAVPGKEEYLNSEKYEIRAWDMDSPGHIKDDIRMLNRLRRRHPALQDFENLVFHRTDNDAILCYAKRTEDLRDYLLFHVNLDPHAPQACHFEVPLWEFGLPDHAGIEVTDLVHGNRFRWHGKSHWLELEPTSRPYAIWRLHAPASDLRAGGA